MQGGAMSQVMSHDSDYFGGHVQIYVCVCMTRWSTSQYSGTVGLSLTNQITGQIFAVMGLGSICVGSGIIKQTPYRAGVPEHM